MSVEMMFERRPAWRVLRAMEHELIRQTGKDGLYNVARLTEKGSLDLSGTVDLAALASVTEAALRKEFGTL